MRVSAIRVGQTVLWSSQIAGNQRLEIQVRSRIVSRRIAELLGSPLNAEVLNSSKKSQIKKGFAEGYHCSKRSCAGVSYCKYAVFLKALTTKSCVKHVGLVGVISTPICEVRSKHRPRQKISCVVVIIFAKYGKKIVSDVVWVASAHTSCAIIQIVPEVFFCLG